MEYPEYNNFSALQHKLDDFLAERHLTGFLQTEQYPITYTIRSNRDLDAQLSMIEEADSGIGWCEASEVVECGFRDVDFWGER